MAKGVKKLRLKAECANASDQGGGWHFLVIPKDAVDKFAFTGKSKRVICSIKGSEPFQCALMPWGGIFYIIVNKKRRTELGLELGQMVDVVLEKDESKYGMPMPDEFKEVLNQDPEGDKLFHSLTAGKQRSTLYFIGKVKGIDKRIHTALIFIEHLKKNGGKIIDEKLREELKRPLF
jgi:hypothetical protein